MEKLGCILLVDDDNDCNYFHKRLIKKLDCAERVEVAYNGEAALEMLKTDEDHNINLVLLDINMPIMDGWKFLEEYKSISNEKKSDRVVVMVTSSLNPDDREKAMSNGVVADFATKYLNAQSLQKIIESHFSMG